MSALALGLIGILAAVTLTAIVMSSVSIYRVDRVPNSGIVGAKGDRGAQGVPGNQGPQGVAGTNGSPADFQTPVATLVNPTTNGWRTSPAPAFIGVGSDYRGTITGTINWTSLGQAFNIIVVFNQPYSGSSVPGSIVVSRGFSSSPVGLAISWMAGGTGSSGITPSQGFTIVLTSEIAPSAPGVVTLDVSYVVIP